MAESATYSVRWQKYQEQKEQTTIGGEVMAESDLKFVEEAFRRGGTERSEVMDKAGIRATAEDIKETFEQAPSCAGEVIEAALTAARDAGWDEAIKAAVKAYYKKPFGVEHIRCLRKGK